MYKAKALLFGILIAAPSRGEDRLVGGPYVVNVGPRSATVAWVVETGQATLGSAPDVADKRAPVLRHVPWSWAASKKARLLPRMSIRLGLAPEQLERHPESKILKATGVFPDVPIPPTPNVWSRAPAGVNRATRKLPTLE